MSRNSTTLNERLKNYTVPGIRSRRRWHLTGILSMFQIIDVIGHLNILNVHSSYKRVSCGCSEFNFRDGEILKCLIKIVEFWNRHIIELIVILHSMFVMAITICILLNRKYIEGVADIFHSFNIFVFIVPCLHKHLGTG